MGFISIIAMIAVFGIILADYSQQINQKVKAESQQSNPLKQNNQDKRANRSNRSSRSNRNNLVLVVPRSYQ